MAQPQPASLGAAGLFHAFFDMEPSVAQRLASGLAGEERTRVVAVAKRLDRPDVPAPRGSRAYEAKKAIHHLVRVLVEEHEVAGRGFTIAALEALADAFDLCRKAPRQLTLFDVGIAQRGKATAGAGAEEGA
jgi:hypothetical protein